VLRGVGVGGHLPAGQVDRAQTRPRALHGLATREATERGHVVLGGDEPPQLVRAGLRDDVTLPDPPPETNDLLGVVRTGDPPPTFFAAPAGAQVSGFVTDLLGARHRSPAFPILAGSRRRIPWG